MTELDGVSESLQKKTFADLFADPAVQTLLSVDKVRQAVEAIQGGGLSNQDYEMHHNELRFGGHFSGNASFLSLQQVAPYRSLFPSPVSHPTTTAVTDSSSIASSVSESQEHSKSTLNKAGIAAVAAVGLLLFQWRAEISSVLSRDPVEQKSKKTEF